MATNLKKGVLITLEGNEGSGKSTQIKLLSRYLKKRGYSVFLTREPGGTLISDQIRRTLLSNRNKKMTPICETLLYMASRAQLVEEVIKPRLAKGQVILCDRWLDATVAYQGYGGGVDLDWIARLGAWVTNDVKPALSIFLDLPLLIGLKRAISHKPADRMERKKNLFHQKVRQGYLEIAKKEPGRFKRLAVDPQDSVERVHEKIKEMVSDVL
jgi:dTMP kinase